MLLLSLAAPVASAAEAGTSPPGAWVRLRDHRVFEVFAADGARTAATRARDASEALTRVSLEAGGPGAVADTASGTPLVRIGELAVLRVVAEDAAAAGEHSADALAVKLAGRLDDVLRAERRRVAWQRAVLAFSLLVVSAFLALVLVRRIGVVDRLVEEWLAAKPQRVPAIAVRGVEVVSRRAVLGGFAVALHGGRVLGQLVVAYLWLLFALSLFEATRGTGDRLRGLVVAPAADLVARLGGAVPVLLVLSLALVAVGVLLRGVRRVLESVATGDTHLRWLPAHLARPASLLARIGIVVLALLFAAPLAGDAEAGPLRGLGTAALVATALAFVPLLASLVAGIPAVFGRHVRAGDLADVAGHVGRVVEVSLLGIRVADDAGVEVRVSHLATLLRPIRVLPAGGTYGTAELVVDAEADPEQVRALLVEAAGGAAAGATAELTLLDASGACWTVRGRARDLGARAAAALRAGRIRLGGGT